MVFFEDILLTYISQHLKEQYGYNLEENDITISQTNKNFKGDFSITFFSIAKKIKKNPISIATEIGERIVYIYPNIFKEYNITNGFLNVILTDKYIIGEFNDINLMFDKNKYSTYISNYPRNKTIVIEFSSPNTNKPLHFGTY
jgi:arginyl-tRNA synthetase